MTNLEINQAIAKAKGIKAFDSCHVNSSAIISETASAEGTYPVHDWAERIWEAWKLFDEMPIGSGIQKFETCYIVTTSVAPPICNDAAPTAALAICLAWLAWKNSK